jgi:hypothetical protein
MIALAVTRATINSSDDGTGFFGFQINGRSAEGLLAANSENAAILSRSGHILPQEVLDKTADGREAAVPCDGGVPASGFDVVQKSQHGVGLDIVQHQG